MHLFKKPRDFDKQFSKAYLQYIADIEGKDNPNDDNDLRGTTSVFATLLLDTTNKDTPYSSNSETFFTLIEGFLTKSVVLYTKPLMDSLNNQALMH